MSTPKPRKRRTQRLKRGRRAKQTALAALRDPVELRRLLRMLPADHPLAILAVPNRHDVRDP
jgi:hypothetical protein